MLTSQALKRFNSSHSSNSSNASDSGSDKAGDSELEVICVGFMRTGLKTLHEALDILGYSGIYDREDISRTYELWDSVLRNRAEPNVFKKIFKGCRVVIGMPSFIFWEEIAELYPDAQVILTIRDEDAWWNSVVRAKSQMDQDLPGAPLRYGALTRRLEAWLVPSYHKLCEVLRFSWAAALGAHALAGEFLNETATRKSYRQHNSFVQSKLGEIKTPSGKPKLLVYDVRHGWEPLCNFLGMPEPEMHPFPSVMTVPYFGDADKNTTDQRKFSNDFTNELEGLINPTSSFGIIIRNELKEKLLILLLGLGFILMLVSGGSIVALPFNLPIAVMTLGYLVVAHFVFNAWVVMYDILPRVPAIAIIPVSMKILGVAFALNGLLVPYGVFKETLVVHDKVASQLLILSSRVMSVICAAVMIRIKDGRIYLGVPLTNFAMFSLANEASTWAGYEMLNYVSFPVQVMAKSCKLLPNMVMGRVINGTRYSALQYIQAIAALVCVIIMQLSDDKTSSGKGAKTADATSGDYYLNMCIGVALLIMFFVMDSYTSQGQTQLYRQYKLSQYQMMLGGNLVACGITMISIIFRWHKVGPSLVVLLTKPDALLRIFGLAMCGALGQFCIYYAIKAFGALTFTWMMTARQLLSVVISLVWFGHGVTITKVVCIGVVFAVLSARQLSAGGGYAVQHVNKTVRRASLLVRKLTTGELPDNMATEAVQQDEANGTLKKDKPKGLRRKRSGAQPTEETGC